MTVGPDRVVKADTVQDVFPLELTLAAQLELFEMLGLTPTIDVTSTNWKSSPCPYKYSTEHGMHVSLAGSCVYAHPLPADAVSVLEHYWESKNDSPYETSGIFVLPSQASSDKHVSRLLKGMELLKEYQSGDNHIKPPPDGSTPRRMATQVWYDPPDSEKACLMMKEWHAINETTKAVYFGPEEKPKVPSPVESRTKKHWWKRVDDPKGRALQDIARRPTKYNRRNQHPGDTNASPVKLKRLDRLYEVNTKTATDMIFNARSGSNQMVTLADSGATGCLMAQDMAERLGLHIRPWEHGTEGFTCANEGIIGINGTATLPFSIQRFKGSAHVHVVDKLPGGLDLILGSDWMRDEKAILDYDDMRLILKKHGCSLIPVNRTRDSSVHSFFTMALSGDSSVDPVISGRKAAKFLKAGANHIMVNIRDSRPVDYPASNVSATETADLLTKAVPSSVHLPNPPEVEVDFETWVKENCPEHGDPALMPAHVVRYLLRKFKKVFNALPMQTPKHRDIPHVIKTEENAYAPYRRNRRMSPAETALCEEYVAGLLKHGFITPSSSPYGAPIMIIAKPGGVGYRVVCDWRALNNITIKNRYPLPRIDETSDRLSGATIFSSLDLTSGYYQIRISDEDAPKTAFTTPMGQYEFKVLGMGLANAPATFQVVMNKIFAPYLHKFVVVYLDDILVYGRNPEEHAANLEKVLQVLQDEEFYAKLSKCTFNQSEIKFLGHIIGRNGVKVNPKKVATVRDWPTPRHAKHVQQFLGLTNYVRKFIQGYSSMAAPLSDLTKLKGDFGAKWTAAHSSAFEGLKTALTSAPVLMLPDFDKPFEVISDASLLGTGAVLLQDKHPVAYSSKKYIPAERTILCRNRKCLVSSMR